MTDRLRVFAACRIAPVRWLRVTVVLAMMSLLMAAPLAAHSQAVRMSEAGVLDTLRAVTARYQNHDTAIANGYRWMGPDMPNMGEHWINPRQVMRPFNLLRPSCLSYIRRGEERVLTGVAYIVPVRSGESYPALPFNAEWHVHRATLDEEAFGHASEHEPASPGTMQLAMMHVWTEVENPDGPFEADNWALNFARLGLPVPSDPSPNASRALFLLAEDGVDFYTQMARKRASLSSSEQSVLSGRLIRLRRELQALVDAETTGAPSVDVLESMWQQAWSDLRPHLRPPVWKDLHPAVLDHGH